MNRPVHNLRLDGMGRIRLPVDRLCRGGLVGGTGPIGSLPRRPRPLTRPASSWSPPPRPCEELWRRRRWPPPPRRKSEWTKTVRSQPQKRKESCGTRSQGTKIGPSTNAVDSASFAHMTCACPMAKTTTQAGGQQHHQHQRGARSNAASSTTGRSVTRFQPNAAMPRRRPRRRTSP